VQIIAKEPVDCSPAELAAFKDLVLAGDEVANKGLDGRIKAAVCLAFSYADDGKLIGICALKEPFPNTQVRSSSEPVAL
jgi:hypothetical protein